MNQYTSQRGVSTATVLIGLALFIGVGGAIYVITRTAPPAEAPTQESPTAEPDEAVTVDQAAPPRSAGTRLADEPGAPDAAPHTYTGQLLAGTSAPLLDFNQADFAAAQASGKLIVLYFYADWCPICRAEFPKTQAAFDQLTTDQVVGFRVNFNDNSTDDDEVALAREHGVAYQHTKVFVQNDTQLLKSPETWETSRYLAEINNALAQ